MQRRGRGQRRIRGRRGGGGVVVRLRRTGRRDPLTPAATPQTLTETGSTLLFPLMGAWATAYHQQHPSVSFTTAGTGSTAGITDASAGKVSIGASDAYLSSGDLVTNPSLLNVPLAISAQQVNYYLPGLSPGVHLKLDGAVLAQMYEGTITSWNDPAIRALNPGVAIPGDQGGAGAPLRRLRRHVPVHQLPVDPFAPPGTARSATARPSPGLPPPAPWPSTGTPAWCPAAGPPRAAWPTSGSATCPTRLADGLGEAAAGQQPGPVRAADAGQHPRRGGELRVVDAR